MIKSREIKCDCGFVGVAATNEGGSQWCPRCEMNNKFDHLISKINKPEGSPRMGEGEVGGMSGNNIITVWHEDNEYITIDAYNKIKTQRDDLKHDAMKLREAVGLERDRMNAGVHGMYGGNGRTPEDHCYEMQDEIIDTLTKALAKFDKKWGSE